MKDKEDLLIILGPTGVGKTTISLEVAKKLMGEIISCDSMQIYKYMDIGTAKVSPKKMGEIPHYLIDLVYPNEEFTVQDFKIQAEKHINSINKSGKLPIMVGGTGLYINSIVYELKFANVGANEEFRRECSIIADKYGNEYLYKKLLKTDAESAKKIEVNDRKRIIRALEIYNETNKPMSYYNKGFRRERDKYNLFMIGLNMDRNILYSRINSRVEEMFKNGLVEEVENLLNMGYDENLVSMKAIGYKEIIPYVKGEIGLEETKELLKRNTRRYAKRQLTWFRRDKRIKWLDIREFASMDSIVDHISKYAKEVLKI